ncbi:hypothetical protein EJ02DRAFT_433719 [Clathrospora elynae]|uniref:Methyltransferase type 11 domain-containing protein n=1 Tax=Clathrospora elynae TaxID=706981 RepID=A0A6A5SVU1_9PLEO|nr:hypothetical protein EJ02DRAFT_433719 [Clathrospora elynae]
MFPTFDVPPQEAETVRARKARKAKADEAARRSSTAASQLSATSTGSVAASSRRPISTAESTNSRKAQKSGFGSWFGKSNKKGVQEISSLPSANRPHNLRDSDTESQLELGPGPAPPTAPLDTESDVYRRQSYCSAQDAPSIHAYHFPPPVRPLPQPPSPRVPGLVSLPERKSQFSIGSRASSNPTLYSGRSVFSNHSGYDTAASEENYAEPRYASNVQFERVGSRTGSRQSVDLDHDHVAKAIQTPFGRALAKMDSAGTRIISARLSEEWEGLEDDESYQEVVFEKRLWFLTGYSRLTQNKHLQSPAHELLSSSRPEDQRRILQIHGSLADGWMLASRYPAATVYTLSSTKSSTLPTAYPGPLNHHSLYVPSLASPTPFPDGYFDAIISRSVATVLRNDEWAQFFFDCMRVLKPGGQIEILTVDAHMSCEGPQLSLWVDENLSCRLERHGVSRQASDTVLDTMEIVGLENIRRARVALPAQPPKAIARAEPPPSHSYDAAMPTPTPQETLDTAKMMAFLGRHFYQDLYSKFVHIAQGEEWFWSRQDTREECQRYNTKMVLTIACAQKPHINDGKESYLDL